MSVDLALGGLRILVTAGTKGVGRGSSYSVNLGPLYSLNRAKWPISLPSSLRRTLPQSQAQTL